MEEFTVGDIVDVKGYGRAEVIEPLCTDEGSQFHGRYRVRYQQNGATYYARPDVLRRTATQVKQRVLLCHSTTHYRTCAASVINYNDAVLEVGSHEGECTWLMSRRCRYIVGVDKSEVTIDAARKRYPGLRFEAVDGFDVAALKALGPPEGFAVVLVDIGGIASLPTVAALVGLYYKEFPWNTKIVVKSVFLKRMMEDCLPYNPAPSNPWQWTTGTPVIAGAPGSAGATAASPAAEPGRGTQGPGEGAESGPSGSGAAGSDELVFNGPRRNGKSRDSRRAAVSASASASAAAAAAAAATGGGGAGEGQGRGGRGQGVRGRGGRGGGRGDAVGDASPVTEPVAAGAPGGAAAGDA